jgi:hypothetical protein
MQFRQQIKWCWLQKKSIIKSGCLEHFSCFVSTSVGKVDISPMSMTWWPIEVLLPLWAFKQYLIITTIGHLLRITTIGHYLCFRSLGHYHHSRITENSVCHWHTFQMVDISPMSMTWWPIEVLLPLWAFKQFTQRASSQSTHHLVAGEFSSILVHGSQLVFEDIPKVINISTFERYVEGCSDTLPKSHFNTAYATNMLNTSLTFTLNFFLVFI